MTALSGDPVTVAAITAGLCGWLVVDEPVELGRHPLAATTEEPWVGHVGSHLLAFYAGRGWSLYSDSGDIYPVPVGRVAATATVTHCLPILDRCPLQRAHVCRSLDDVLFHTALNEPGDDGNTETDITEQTVWQSGGWLPGRWALKVTDPTPVEAP